MPAMSRPTSPCLVHASAPARASTDHGDDRLYGHRTLSLADPTLARIGDVPGVPWIPTISLGVLGWSQCSSWYPAAGSDPELAQFLGSWSACACESAADGLSAAVAVRPTLNMSNPVALTIFVMVTRQWLPAPADPRQPPPGNGWEPWCSGWPVCYRRAPRSDSRRVSPAWKCPRSTAARL